MPRSRWPAGRTSAEDEYELRHGRFATTLRQLADVTYSPPAATTIRIVSANQESYCLSATPTGGGETLYLESTTRQPTSTPCS